MNDGHLTIPIPGVPSFTYAQIGSALAILLVVVFLIKGWNMIKGHPVILIVLVIVAIAAFGFATLHVPGAPPGSKLH